MTNSKNVTNLNIVKNTNLRARWDVINESPKVVLDVGHNLHAFKENLKMFNNLNYDKLRIVIGFVKGKDFIKILNNIIIIHIG